MGVLFGGWDLGGGFCFVFRVCCIGAGGKFCLLGLFPRFWEVGKALLLLAFVVGREEGERKKESEMGFEGLVVFIFHGKWV